MDELVQWLGKQLDAEAAHSRQVADKYGAEWEAARDWVSSDTGTDVIDEAGAPVEFIAAHDPARVLREIDTKRQLMEGHEPDECVPPCCTGCVDDHPCRHLRLLALPYADRPGYREDWRP
ncbi:DUF6221 family protein [Streptomyces sp. NPDC007148]|uniref:DUF6221 family protein n=1 Tax=Streptomyces sp. NPDC007148 TaxID=3364775 RepID=UPI0036B2BFDE